MGKRNKLLRHGSLFSGIGGFDLAAEWMGWKNIFHCEFDAFCQKVLNYYYPKAKSYGDIKKTDFTNHKGKIDILTGGFPCQPYSVAGKRLGKDDERHLWPDMLRAVREIRPLWVVAENVLGIVSWNDGMVFEEVHTDLEAEGYQVQAFVLPAAGINAPHRRERVWFVAYRDGIRFQETRKEQQAKGIEQCRGLGGTITDSINIGCNDRGDNREGGYIQDHERITEKDKPERERRECGIGETGKITGNTECDSFQDERIEPSVLGKKDKRGKAGRSQHAAVQDYWADWPTQPPICIRDDGLQGGLDVEAIFETTPFPIKPITYSKWRIGSIKALGNAIVPQVALQLFKIIQKMTN